MLYGRSEVRPAPVAPDFPYVQTDAGRSTSARPRQQSDCTVRALALAVRIPYDEAYAVLAQAGRKSSERFRFKDWVTDAEVNGKRFIRTTFPSVTGKRRMNPGTFCSSHPAGTYVIQTAKHVAVVIDGVLYDDTPMKPDRCIYACWEVK